MLCENCGKNHANVQYTEIINGEKKQVFLCEECSQKLGIGKMDFNIPINFSSFFGDFLEEFQNSAFMPTLDMKNDIKCDSCNMTFEEFLNTGKFGCSNCYNAFESKIDPILKKIHGNNKHIGRIGKITENNNVKFEDSHKVQEDKKEINEVDKLKEELKNAIKEERYEDAAKIRDEIKKLEK